MVGLSPAERSAKCWLRTVFCSLVLIGQGCSLSKPPKAVSTAKVERGPLRITVVEEGELRALRETTIMSKQPGTIEWLCAEGKQVKAGDVLVEIEKDRYEELLEQNTVELQEATANLEELQRNSADEKKLLEEGVDAAKVALEIKKLERKQLLDGPTEREKKEAEADLRSAEITATEAWAEFERAQELGEAGIISQNEVQRARIEAKIAEANLENMRFKHERLLAGATELEIREAELGVQTAELNLDIAKENLAAGIGRLQSDIAEAEARVKRAQSTLKRMRREIEQRTIRAPHEGVVVYFKPRSTRRRIEVGTRIWVGAGIMELPDLRRMKVLTQVSEFDVRYIRVGDPATVTVDMIEGETYQGRVIWIDKWGHDRNEKLDASQRRKYGLAGINVFDVEVAIDKEDPRLKLGFNAKVEFSIRELKDVLSVPKNAVQFRNHKYLVTVLTPAGPEPRNIVVGDESHDRIVVKEGLKEGEEVVVPA